MAVGNWLRASRLTDRPVAGPSGDAMFLSNPAAAAAPQLDETPRAADGTPLKLETATFALGCFWGSDAQFGGPSGVYRTRPGFTGGQKLNPTYHNLDDHTEAVEVDFDPQQISYAQLLKVYFAAGAGETPPYSRQYRSAVFYHSEAQRAAAQAALDQENQHRQRQLYVDIEPAGVFYRAEDYHHKYHLRQDRRLGQEVRKLFSSEQAFEDSTLAARLNALAAGYKLDAQQIKALPLDLLSPVARERFDDLERQASGHVIHCS
jgi:methionine-S-sulfoxide reductase